MSYLFAYYKPSLAFSSHYIIDTATVNLTYLRTTNSLYCLLAFGDLVSLAQRHSIRGQRCETPARWIFVCWRNFHENLMLNSGTTRRFYFENNIQVRVRKWESRTRVQLKTATAPLWRKFRNRALKKVSVHQHLVQSAGFGCAEKAQSTHNQGSSAWGRCLHGYRKVIHWLSIDHAFPSSTAPLVVYMYTVY